MSTFDLPTWVHNDAAKISRKPGFDAMHQRVVLAADALDAVLVVHAGCKPSLCPTVAAYRRVLRDAGYRGEARFGSIGDEGSS